MNKQIQEIVKEATGKSYEVIFVTRDDPKTKLADITPYNTTPVKSIVDGDNITTNTRDANAFLAEADRERPDLYLMTKEEVEQYKAHLAEEAEEVAKLVPVLENNEPMVKVDDQLADYIMVVEPFVVTEEEIRDITIAKLKEEHGDAAIDKVLNIEDAISATADEYNLEIK